MIISTRHIRGVALAAVMGIAGATLLGPALHAQTSSARPITAANFERFAPRGFGDRNNSWAHSMVWWHDNLYVGTTRESFCSSMFAIWEFATGLFGPAFADTFLPYPPKDPEMSCAPDGADLSLQAEIWRWSPGGNSWTRVFQSPLDLDNPGPGGGLPPREGKKLPYEMGIRGLTPHIEPDGTEALYAFGVNTTIMWDRAKLPPPRILRTTDGVTFTAIPQTPGTFLGDLPFNPDHSSYRSPVSFGGRLFVLNGPVFGQGSLIASADPAKGDDAWFLAAPADMVFYEMGVFNGWLYLGTFNPFAGGYSVVKTRAEGQPPYEFVTVVPKGAFHPDPLRPSKSVVSMHEYLGRLYVGTATLTEIIRINPDDTWDLVVGPPRQVPTRDGGSEWKYPTSGLDAGFGHSLNDHAWQMDDPYRYLYVGTYNASVASKSDPVYGPLLEHNMGAHLYRTRDGWYFSAITTNGFADPSDPFGGANDYGIRTMASTPQGAFFGTTNDHYGLMIFRAATRGSTAPDPPERLEIEPIRNDRALLSWQAVPGADSYQVWRAEIHPILVRDELNFEAWNGIFLNKIPDTYIGPYELIGTSRTSTFIDSTLEAGKKYMYYVLTVKQLRLSDQSNLVAFPLLNPPMTFARLLNEVDRWEQRGRFVSGTQAQALRLLITGAQIAAAQCQISQAIKTLSPLKASDYLLQPEAIDLEVTLGKLTRRLSLFKQFPLDLFSGEFCTASS